MSQIIFRTKSTWKNYILHGKLHIHKFCARQSWCCNTCRLYAY